MTQRRTLSFIFAISLLFTLHTTLAKDNLEENARALAAAVEGDEEGLIDINIANQKALLRIPGIGPKTADKIVNFREEHGPFSELKQIMKVKGIGPAKLETMTEFIEIDPETLAKLEKEFDARRKAKGNENDASTEQRDVQGRQAEEAK